MARIRTIKPDFWTDEAIVELEMWERLLFIGMWNFADDQGYIHYSPKRIKMQVFPGDSLDVSVGLARLLEASLLEAFDVLSTPGAVVLRIRGWDKHQRVSNPAQPRFGADDLQIRAQLPASSVALASPPEGYSAEGKGREGKGGSSRSLASKPERDELGYHPTADHLCSLLVELMVANECRKPTITKEWRQQARLLIDTDKIDPALAEHVLRWSQADTFWKANIQSMPTFRGQFDKLRTKRKEEHERIKNGGSPNGSVPGQSLWDREVTA